MYPRKSTESSRNSTATYPRTSFRPLNRLHGRILEHGVGHTTNLTRPMASWTWKVHLAQWWVGSVSHHTFSSLGLLLLGLDQVVPCFVSIGFTIEILREKTQRLVSREIQIYRVKQKTVKRNTNINKTIRVIRMILQTDIVSKVYFRKTRKMLKSTKQAK